MVFVRFTRRRRFTTIKIFLILFSFFGIILWISLKNYDEEEKEYLKHSQFRNSDKEIDIWNDFKTKASPLAVEFDTFSKRRNSVLHNAELLQKLLTKTSQSSKNRAFISDVKFSHKNFAINNAVLFPQLKVTPGLGENGVPVHLPKKEQVLADKMFNEAAFNVYLSDRISLNRSVPDPRNPKCEYEIYDKDLPTASIIIIFTNEILSALLRTIHSVVNRTPSHLLHEIILVDDFSERDELESDLDKYLLQNFKPGLIKMIRFHKRQGLIRARLAGAKQARGNVLIFLDSHCEANNQWIEPLLHRIKESRSAVVCPIIDVIDDKTFEYYASNLEYFQIGGFTWNGHFTWVEIPEKEEQRKRTEVAPTRTPTMAGGLFAIDRDYFWEIGSYDSGMEIWGGENLEMSFRIWMCGGTLEIVPCSHVGHVFRSFHPYKFPNNKDTHGLNTVRTVEVWMDEYKKYFYLHRPDLQDINYGSIKDRLDLKTRLQCKPFQWYLDEIYPEKFIFDKGVSAYGTLRNPWLNLCIDTLNRDEDKREPIGYFACKPKDAGVVINQLISLTDAGELRIEENCAEVNEKDFRVMMEKCHGKGSNQLWTHTKGGVVKHVKTGICLDVRDQVSGSDAVVKPCHGNFSQIWWFENYAYPAVSVRNNNTATAEELSHLLLKRL